MPTDRQRVELMLPAHMMLGVFLNGVDEKDEPAAVTLKAKLVAASIMPVADVMEPARSKLIRRAARAYHEITDGYTKEGATVGKMGLISFHLLRVLLDCEYLVMPGGSPMSDAMDEMLPLLDEAYQEEALDRSARKQARRVLGHLQRLGYYPGVAWPAEMEEAA